MTHTPATVRDDQILGLRETDVGGVLVREVDTAAYGTIFDAKGVSDTLGLYWDVQRERLTSARWAVRVRVHFPGTQNYRTFVTRPTLAAWMTALTDPTRSRVPADVKTRAAGVLGFVDNTAAVPASPTTGGDPPVVARRTPPTPEAALLAPDGPVARFLETLSRTLTAAHEAAAEKALTSVRDGVRDAVMTQGVELAKLRDEVATIQLRLGAITAQVGAAQVMADQAAQGVTGEREAAHPTMVPTVTIDAELRQCGIKLPYDTVRQLSAELRRYCDDTRIPVRAEYGAGRQHVYHKYPRTAVRAFLKVKGYLK